MFQRYRLFYYLPVYGELGRFMLISSWSPPPILLLHAENIAARSYGVAPDSQLPAIPMAIPMGWPQPPSYQLFLCLFQWGGPSLPVFLWGGPSLPVTS